MLCLAGTAGTGGTAQSRDYTSSESPFAGRLLAGRPGVSSDIFQEVLRRTLCTCSGVCESLPKDIATKPSMQLVNLLCAFCFSTYMEMCGQTGEMCLRRTCIEDEMKGGDGMKELPLVAVI